MKIENLREELQERPDDCLCVLFVLGRDVLQ